MNNERSSIPLWGKVLAGFFSAALFFVLLFGAGKVLLYLDKRGDGKHTYSASGAYTKGWLIDDETLGYRPGPGRRVDSEERMDGSIIYSAVYSTDEFSRRVTPVKGRGQRGRFLLCFGCSFMFGQGVNDDETLPYHLGRLLPGYMPYNYGYCGYGTQQMLAKLASPGLKREIKEKKGAALYLLIDSHITRAIGSLSVTSSWGKNMPYYALDGGNNVVKKGTFGSGRKVRTWLYRRFASTDLGEYYLRHGDFPVIGGRHIALTARLIEESRDAFRRAFDSDEFYVVLYPGSGQCRQMLPYFREKGIKYVDYNDVPGLNAEPYIIPNNGHPSAQAYRRVAEMIVKDIPSLSRAGD